MVFEKLKKRVKERFAKADKRLGGFLPGGITPKESRAQKSEKKKTTSTTQEPKTSVSRSGRAAIEATGQKFLPEQRSGGTLNVEKGAKQIAFFEKQLAEGKFRNPIEETELRNAIIQSKKDFENDLGSLAVEQEEARRNPQQEKLSGRDQFDADVKKGLVLGAKIGVPLAIGIVTFGTGAIGLSTLSKLVRLVRTGKSAKNVLNANRAGANLNKLVRANKISYNQATKVSKAINKLRVDEIAKQLSSKSFPKQLFSFKGQIIAAGITGIGQWYAADNMASGAKIQSNGLVNRVKFGDMEKDLALESIDEFETLAKISRAFMVGSMAVAPLTAPFALLYLRGINADIKQIEVNRTIIESL
ncbi:hypothetical protein LCGC14_1244130 [marine sediment metagenome]|uniref:Uncharacterized protein n=1 Tax=marine sediment metagenome TaxID=412755 RepID=A0A0F9LS49_9ZZZZ